MVCLCDSNIALVRRYNNQISRQNTPQHRQQPALGGLPAFHTYYDVSLQVRKVFTAIHNAFILSFVIYV